MQETSDIANKVLADHAERRCCGPERARSQARNEVRVRPSLLPEEYTPIQNLLAGWYYCAYEPCDVGSVKYVESGSDEVLRRRSGRRLSRRLWTRVWRSWVLEEHLSKHAYCCGDAPGLDDIMRFVVLQILFVNLGELWGFDAPLYARLPHVKRWMLAMRRRDSNPQNRYVHDDELYYRAHRDWWTKKMPQRLFPSVEVEARSAAAQGHRRRQSDAECLKQSTTRAPTRAWCCASRAGDA